MAKRELDVLCHQEGVRHQPVRPDMHDMLVCSVVTTSTHVSSKTASVSVLPPARFYTEASWRTIRSNGCQILAALVEADNLELGRSGHLAPSHCATLPVVTSLYLRVKTNACICTCYTIFLRGITLSHAQFDGVLVSVTLTPRGRSFPAMVNCRPRHIPNTK